MFQLSGNRGSSRRGHNQVCVVSILDDGVGMVEGCRSEATTSKVGGLKPEPCTTPGIDVSNFRCPSGIARHVRAVLEKADDEVIDSIRNVEEGEFAWFTLNSARTFRRPSFQRTQLGAANHSAYSNR